jgi:hypothetical protein
MGISEADVVVLGAGPAGLACAYELAKRGRKPLVVERGKQPGGLMRSIERHGFRVDVGRKELYSRLPDVHGLWTELLGDDYRPYPHRVGVLWRGHIIERSSAFRGVLRGMPPGLLVAGAADFALRQLVNPWLPPPRNEEEYWFRLRGETFARALSQGHAEKFQGYRWSELPAPAVDGKGSFAARAYRSVFGRAVAKDHGTVEWRHPVRSTGQIVDALVAGIESRGGALMLDTQVDRLLEQDGQVVGIRGRRGDEEFSIRAEHVVSSVPLDILARLRGEEPPKDLKARDTRKRSTVLVYLFLDEPPRFPHAWLDVTDPDLRAGRIANFAGFHGEMVPLGKSCLAVEFFLVGDDPLLTAPEDALFGLAIDECARSGLISSSKVFDHLVIRLPGVFAADDYRSWQSPGVSALLDRIEQVPNLWNVNRAGSDVATQAGLTAARSIASADRAKFLREADPRRPLGIDSTRLWA